MSLLQKFSIKKINKIRKVLLLYIDKDLKLHFKNKNHKNSLARRLIDNNIINEKSYSQPIQIEQNFSNESQIENEFIPIRNNSHHFTISENNFIPNIDKVKSRGSSHRANSLKINNHQEILNLKLISNNKGTKDIIYNLNKISNGLRNINKYNKKFIIIKDDKTRLRKKNDSLNYLANLYRNFKVIKKRKKCLSTKKIKNEKKNDEKETILEVKEKQKGNNNDKKNGGKASVLVSAKNMNMNMNINININNMNMNNSEEINDMILLMKKQKRRSLFAKDK